MSETVKKQEENKPEKTGKNQTGLIIVLIIILLILIGLLVWQHLTNKKQEVVIQQQTTTIVQVTSAKDSIAQDFKNLLSDYEGVKTNNDELNQMIEGQKAELETYLQKINTLQANSAELKSYKKKYLELVTNRDNLIAKIDSLTNANAQLTTEKTQLSDSLNKTQSENMLLSNRVAVAAKVKGANLVVKALSDKDKPQTKAKKIYKLEICITLVENSIAVAGDKDVYYRIVNNKGNVLVKNPENLFESNEQKLAYSAKVTINYQNALITACTSYTVNSSELVAGTYDIEAYTDGALIGSTSVTFE